MFTPEVTVIIWEILLYGDLQYKHSISRKPIGIAQAAFLVEDLSQVMFLWHLSLSGH